MKKSNTTAVFDEEQNIKKWTVRLTTMRKDMLRKISDPLLDVYLDAIEETIKNTPATSGETKAGWAKPLEVEGRSLAAIISPQMGILSKKDVVPTEAVIRKGMEKSIYRKEIEDKSMNLETINGTPGAVYTEYGNSRTPPTAAVRQAGMKLVNDVKEVVIPIIDKISK